MLRGSRFSALCLLLGASFATAAAAGASPCAPSTVPHSNVTASVPCTGALGDICPFSCDAGYLGVGQHVCQSYDTARGVTVFDNVFFGGRCDPLCTSSAAPCGEGLVPVRRNVTTTSASWCLATTCTTADDALRRLARGAYGVWRLGRDEASGMYSGTVDTTAPSDAQDSIAHIGVNGLGLMFECVAAEMGWVSRSAAAARVNVSLTALAGEMPGFELVRQASDGWMLTFFNRSNGGKVYGQQPYTVLDSGLNSAGVLFARDYFLGTAARDTDPAARALTANIARLGKKVFNLVRFERLLCNAAGEVDPHGTSIPFTLDDNHGCGALHAPLADGFYDYSELHYTVWLAWGRMCGDAPPGTCADPAIEAMWTAWQGRRLHPMTAYRSHPLLSTWSSYIVHLPFYSSHSFNADDSWSALFASHWAADREYFGTSAYNAGLSGRYGLGAGPTDRWCSTKDTTYEADMLAGDHASQGAQGCRMFSPYAVAGYLPAAEAVITADLLALLAAGEAVAPIDSFVVGDYVLLRKSLIEQGWSQNDHVTMVDFASELFGLSTLWLGVDFWRTYSNHTWADLRSDTPAATAGLMAAASVAERAAPPAVKSAAAPDAAAPAPAATTPAAAAPSPVTLLLNGLPAAVGNYTKTPATSLVFNNGLLLLKFIARGDGLDMTSFVVGGVDIATKTGEEAWYQDWAGGKGGDVAGVDTVRVLRVTSTLVEVAFADTRHPQRRLEQHVIMTSGVRGVYTFTAMTVVAAGEELNEIRHNTRWDRCVLNFAFNHERPAGQQPTYPYLDTQLKIQDETWRVDGVPNPHLPCPSDNDGNADGQLPAGSVYTKYAWRCDAL